MGPTPATQVCQGLLACSLSYIGWADVFPVITAIGAIAGCFVALHGVYCIIKGWIHGRRITDNYPNNH